MVYENFGAMTLSRGWEMGRMDAVSNGSYSSLLSLGLF